MTLTKLLTPIAIVAALSLTAVPAHAQRRGGGGSSHATRGAAVSRGSAVPRGGVVTRGSAVGRIGVAPGRGFVGGGFYRPYYAFRPRLSIGFGIWAGYPYPYYYGGYGYPPYAYGYGYPAYDPYAYNNYAPLPYDYSNASPYGYPADPADSQGYPPQQQGYPPQQQGYPPQQQGYPPQQGYQQQAPAGSIGVQPGGQQTNSGGVSFEITPTTAAVFVDGTYVGTTGEFGPTAQPLGLAPGKHHFEVRAAGYKTLSFDTDVAAGQVIPYRGALEAQH
jgi:hypothetical protein